MSADGVQHDHRDLALGLLLVIGVGRPELQRLFPQPRALLARGGPGPRFDLCGPGLHVDLRVGEDVAVPAGVLRGAAFRGDHDIAIPGFPAEQREDESLSRLPAGRRQQQPSVCWRVAMVLFAILRYHLGNRAAIGKRMAILRKAFEITAQWDAESGVWWCSNDELPLTTEAPTFEELVARVLEIAPEIAAENGLAAPGDEIELHIVAERVQSVRVVAAA